MAAVSPEPVNTCTIGFDEAAYDESDLALQVARHYSTRHRTDRVDTMDFDLLDTLARNYDEPFADSSAMPTYRVCGLAWWRSRTPASSARDCARRSPTPAVRPAATPGWRAGPWSGW
jgi:hypothetical protein